MFKFWKRKRAESGGDLPAPFEGKVELLEYEVEVSLQSDVGCYREINEDRGRYIQPSDPDKLAKKGMLFIVADGMGGHSAGEVASQMAVDVISRAYYESAADAPAALKAAFEEANRQIHRASASGLGSMGTTATALVLRNGSALAAHVGDSRLYLVRAGEIYLMTEDHSAVMEMVKRGLLTLEEARHHADKNIILRALGSHPKVDVSMWEEPFPIRIGDSFLLCSDGLYDLVEDEEIKQVIVQFDPHNACKKLIELAKQRGGYDNITVGIISIKPASESEKGGARETREMEILQ
jgi:serine/threonine protein phosphatase PrpC